MLVVDGLIRCFGPVVVLPGVRFAVEAGHAAAVVGPNGAGKTTLLRCVVSAGRPDEGRVLIDGRPLRRSTRRRARRSPACSVFPFRRPAPLGEDWRQEPQSR